MLAGERALQKQPRAGKFDSYNQRSMESPVTQGTAPRKPATAGKWPMLSMWLRDLVISLAISGFIIVFLYQPVKVEGTSMMPSLEDQERIFVNKFVYRLESIQRGDIVVFRYPRDPSKSFIKRVIGVAGDHIRMDSRINVLTQMWLCPRILILFWATIAQCRTTAVISDQCRLAIFMARQFLVIGQWISLAGCAEC